MSLEQLDKCAKIMKLDPNIHEMLKYPKRVLCVNVPIKMDNGKTKVFVGYRSQHNDALGPFKGGVRYHPNVSVEEVMALSIWMTWKCSVAGIPLGGGKGGIICDPKKLSVGELERLSRGYFAAIRHIVGPDLDIPAPDVNTGGREMAWFLDEYNKYKGCDNPGVVTGKPLEIGGSLGRTEATGRGLSIIAREAAKKLGIDFKKSDVAVQGFGNVGYYSAKFMQEFGCTVVALSDSNGGVCNPKGIDVEEALKYKQKHGKLSGFPGSKDITNEEALEVKCDILIPAALENQITKENAGRIKAKLVLEGANGPTAPEADEMLLKKGTVVVPDILANAGGVSTSYFEWVQNRQNYYWTYDEVLQRLDKLMTNAFANVWASYKKYNVEMRMAAYICAIERVTAAMKLKGWC